MGTVFNKNNTNRGYRSRRVTATADAGREVFYDTTLEKLPRGAEETGKSPSFSETAIRRRKPSLWNLTRPIPSVKAILDVWGHFLREDDRSGMPTVEKNRGSE
jgi:hypothetical protein